jgi:transposase-like protein
MGTRRKYIESFKKDAVRLFLARGEQTAQDVAEGLGVKASQLYRWNKKYGPELTGPSVSGQRDEELAALRRRTRQLEMENALLKKGVVRLSCGLNRQIGLESIDARQATVCKDPWRGAAVASR